MTIVDYEEFWKDHKSGPPAADVRQGYHIAPRHTDFNRLCYLAERRGMHVGLCASSALLSKGQLDQRRVIDRIRVSAKNDRKKVLASRPASATNLNEPALALIAALT